VTKRAAKTLYREDGVETGPGTLGDLYAEYRERLLRFVTFRVGGDSHAAEDIVQEAFAAAVVALAGFRERSSPYTWLCSIAQHKVADYYRDKTASGCAVSLEEPDGCSDPRDADLCSSVERWFEDVETRSMVRHAISNLPHTYRQVLRLKYFDGLSVAEVGVAMGRSSKSVEGLLARARHSLHRNLSESTDS
jgi:RNA polymerase sigma-70 factor, ECF subfamily